jgi:hypothetical protein
LPASPLSASRRGHLPGDFGPRAFCRGSLAPPARGPEGPGRWRSDPTPDPTPDPTVARPDSRPDPTRPDRGSMATELWQEGRRPDSRPDPTRLPTPDTLWRAGNRTVARGPQFRDAGPRHNAREPRSGDIPTPRKASQTALRGPRSMVSARGPRPPIPGKGRNFGGLGPLPRSMRGLRAPSRQYAKRLGVAIFLGVA